MTRVGPTRLRALACAAVIVGGAGGLLAGSLPAGALAGPGNTPPDMELHAHRDEPTTCSRDDLTDLPSLDTAQAETPGALAQPEWQIGPDGHALTGGVSSDEDVVVLLVRWDWLGGVIGTGGLGNTSCLAKWKVEPSDGETELDLTTFANQVRGSDARLIALVGGIRPRVLDVVSLATAAPEFREGLARSNASIAMLEYADRLEDEDWVEDEWADDFADDRVDLLRFLAVSQDRRIILFEGDPTPEQVNNNDEKKKDDSLFAEITGGNPFTDDHVQFLVPGTGTAFQAGYRHPVPDAEGTTDPFVLANNWIMSAELIRTEADAQANLDHQAGSPREKVAGVAWLGFDAPECLPGECVKGAAYNDFALGGAQRLADWVDSITHDDQHVTLIGHSYGTVVTGAAIWLGRAQNVDDVVSVGSPGLGVRLSQGPGKSSYPNPLPVCEYLVPSPMDDQLAVHRWPADCFGDLTSQHLWGGIAEGDVIRGCDVMVLKDCHGTGPHLTEFGGHIFHVNCPASDPPEDGCPEGAPTVGGYTTSKDDVGDAHGSYFAVVGRKTNDTLPKPASTRKKESLRNTAKVVAGNYSWMSMEDVGQGQMPSDWRPEPDQDPDSESDVTTTTVPTDPAQSCEVAGVSVDCELPPVRDRSIELIDQIVRDGEGGCATVAGQQTLLDQFGSPGEVYNATKDVADCQSRVARFGACIQELPVTDVAVDGPRVTFLQPCVTDKGWEIMFEAKWIRTDRWYLRSVLPVGSTRH